MTHPVFHLIDGQAVAGSGEPVEMVEPATGATVGQFAAATASEVGQAVVAARRSFEAGVWSRRPWRERQAVLRRIAAAIRGAAAELAAIQVRETGLLPDKVRGHVVASAGWFDHFADYLSTECGEYFPQLDDYTTFVRREPVGVCALFAPWNQPTGLTTIKLAPALAAGNSVVLKPSELVPQLSCALVELIRGAGLPDGVFNCVNGPGATTGAALAGAAVDAIAFTGGSQGGRAVALAAAQRHVPVMLELGGKSATVVFADADLPAAVEGAIQAIYSNNGEACLAGSRILVEEGCAEDFLAAFRTRAEAFRAGPPGEPGVELGPMISAAHRGRVESFFASAAADGDRLVCGGAPAGGAGFFVPATAYLVNGPGSRLWREEVFGPVAAIATFRDEAEAVAMANDSDFGLVGYVWTRDTGRALRMGNAIRAGQVLVNTTIRRELNSPFGGYKGSGLGREGGRYSWEHFTEAKAVLISHG